MMFVLGIVLIVIGLVIGSIRINGDYFGLGVLVSVTGLLTCMGSLLLFIWRTLP